MILNINKPLGLTSFDVVACVRKALGEKKVGHAGTLDPMATGVLVVAVGREFTKQIDQLMSGEKEYIAEIILGATTDSLDRDGQVTQTAPVSELTKEQIDASVQSFIGTIAQIPPSFSAIHHKGERAYKLARAGNPVVLPPRIVTINKIEILAYPVRPSERTMEELVLSSGQGNCPALRLRSVNEGRGVLPEEAFDDFPQLTIKVTCEKGVYIRSLARDIGEALGTVAFLKSLVRTKVGDYRIEESLELEKFSFNLFPKYHL